VVTPSAAIKPNPPTPATFDRNDKGHVAVVNNFLGGRKQLNLLDSLCERLNGKPFTQSNIRLEFSAIDAEKPDQSPDEE
jgi:hypothetical protein